MARKTTENTTAKRIKKTTVSVQPETVQVADELRKAEPSKEIRMRKNGKAAGSDPVNLEEAIRRRAYELYLERRATAGGDIGDENQDWLVAEREILSRHGGHGQHTA
jgi:DNA-binding PucR family transcriptional regulator